MDPIVTTSRMDVPQHLHGYLEAQKGNMRDSQFRSLQKLCSFLDDSQNQRGSVHQLRVMLRSLVSDNELLSDWVLNILGAYVVHRSSEPNTLQILLTLFKVLLSIQDKLISDRVRRIMGYMIKLWEKLVHDESASDTLVEYLDFVECEMLVETSSIDSVTTASLGEGSESGSQDEAQSDTSLENSSPAAGGGSEPQVNGSDTKKEVNVLDGRNSPRNLSYLDLDNNENLIQDQDISVAPPVPQLTAVFLVKEARNWVNRVILACHKDVREAGKRLICTVVKLSSGPGCLLTQEQVKEIQPLRIFRNIFSHILALGDGAETVLETLHYVVLKSAKHTDHKIYEQFLQDITDLWCNVTVILRMCLNKAFSMVKFPSEARTDVTKANIDNVENTLTCALELTQPISNRQCFVDDYALHQCIMKCCLKFGVFQSSMKKEEAQRYDILFSGLIKLCVHSVSTPILKEIYEISSSHQDIVMHFIYHFFVHESLLNVMPQTAQLTSNLILPMIRAGGLAEKTIDSFFGWLDPNKDNDIYLKKTRLTNLVHLLTSIKGDEEFSDNLCKKLAIWEAMRGQIFKISAMNKSNVHNQISDFDRRMRRVATERAALAQSQLLEMLDNEEREAKEKERKAKRNKRTKARRKKKKAKETKNEETHQVHSSSPDTTPNVAPRHFPQQEKREEQETVTMPGAGTPQGNRKVSREKMALLSKRHQSKYGHEARAQRALKEERTRCETSEPSPSKQQPTARVKRKPLASPQKKLSTKDARNKFPRSIPTSKKLTVTSIKQTKQTRWVAPNEWPRPVVKNKVKNAWGTNIRTVRVVDEPRKEAQMELPNSGVRACTATTPPPSRASHDVRVIRNTTEEDRTPPSDNSQLTQSSAGTSVYESNSVGHPERRQINSIPQNPSLIVPHMPGYEVPLNIRPPEYSIRRSPPNPRSLFGSMSSTERTLSLNLTTNKGPEIPEVNPWNAVSPTVRPHETCLPQHNVAVQPLFPGNCDERQRDIEQNLNKLIGFGSSSGKCHGSSITRDPVFPLLNTKAKSFEPKSISGMNGFDSKPSSSRILSLVQRARSADKLTPSGN